jgi:hypothetical protein
MMTYMSFGGEPSSTSPEWNAATDTDDDCAW